MTIEFSLRSKDKLIFCLRMPARSSSESRSKSTRSSKVLKMLQEPLKEPREEEVLAVMLTVRDAQEAEETANPTACSPKSTMSEPDSDSLSNSEFQNF